MVNISKSGEVHSTVDTVWKIICDTDRDEKYWSAIRDVKVLSRDGNTIVREADVGPRGFGHRSRQTLVLDPKKSITLRMEGGPMAGERTMVVVPMGKNDTRIDVAWNFELKDVPAFVQGLVKNQISKVTEKALEKIAVEAERNHQLDVRLDGKVAVKQA